MKEIKVQCLSLIEFRSMIPLTLWQNQAAQLMVPYLVDSIETPSPAANDTASSHCTTDPKANSHTDSPIKTVLRNCSQIITKLTQSPSNNSRPQTDEWKHSIHQRGLVQYTSLWNPGLPSYWAALSMLNWGATFAESSSGEILNKVTTHYWPHDVTHEKRNKKWVSIGDQMEWDGKGNYMAKIQLYTKHCQRNTK